MKVKAAECHMLLNFAIHMSRKHLAVLPRGVNLHQASVSLEEWCLTCRGARTRLTVSQYQRLLDTCRVCIFQSQDAGIHSLPKHHSFGHLTIRTHGYITREAPGGEEMMMRLMIEVVRRIVGIRGAERRKKGL
eukprot:6028717-Pyramimonas_sp.AAC.1